MWCELVMMPNGTHQLINPATGHPPLPLSASNTGVSISNGLGSSPPGLQSSGVCSTPAVSSYNAALAAAVSGLQYHNIPALTGVPINKDTKLTLHSNLVAAQQLAAGQKVDTTNHYHIFVGDLGSEVESHHLRDAFSISGVVTDCKIIKDMHTQKPKGYGFVSYATKEEAEDALIRMNGTLVGSRAIRTNWAVRRPPQPPDQKPLDYDEVSQAASGSNCTVYVGGITKGLCEDVLRDSFKDYGDILEVRVFREKGYAFVRFQTHEGATRAIITMHGKDVAGQPCKCSWGKESNDMKQALSQTVTPGPYNILPQLNQLTYSYNPLSYLQPTLGYTTPYPTNGYRA